MKNVLKKVLSVVMAVMVVACALSACSSAATAPETAAPAATEAAKPAETKAAETKAAETEAAKAEAAAADEWDPSDKYIGIITYPSSNTTIAVFTAGALMEAENLGYQPLLIGGDTTDAAAVQQMVEAAVAQYPTLCGVSINPGTETKWNMVKTLTDADIPVVAVWSDVSKDDAVTYGVNPDLLIGCVPTDPEEYGRDAALAIGEAIGGKGKVAITENNFNYTEDLAAATFKATMADKYPDVECLDPQLESADVTAGIGVVTSIIQANFSELTGAFGTTGTSPQSWSQAAEATGWEGCIIGMDATSANLDILEAGGVYGLVAQPMYDAWALASDIIDMYWRGESYEWRTVGHSPVIFAEDAPNYRDLLAGVDTFTSPFE